MKLVKSALIFISMIAVSACSTAEKKTASGYAGHGASSVDPKVIAQFAPPAVDQETTALVQNLLEVTTPGLGMLNPGGQKLFFTWPVTGSSQIWRLDSPLGFPVQMTSGTDRTTISFMDPMNGAFMIVSRDRAGEENPGIYLLPTAGGALEEIQHKKGVRTSAVWIDNAGEVLYYLSNDIKQDSYALYSYTIATKKKELLFSDPGLWYVADVYGDRTFLFARMTGATTREFFTWNLSEKKLIPVIGQDEREEYDVTFGSSSEKFFVLTPKLGDFNRLYSMRLGKKDLKPVTPDVKMEVQDFSIDNSRMHLYISWNDGGRDKLEIRNARTLKIVNPLKRFEKADQVIAGAPSRRGRFVGIGVETGVQPRTNYIFDWKTNKLTQWTRPSVPEFDPKKFRPATLEFYPARDGTQIPMWVTRPNGCEKEAAGDPCPVIVNFHGGPESQSRPGFNVRAQIFANAGFVYADPNVRGSEGYGRKYRDADNGVKRLEVITDIEDCARHIKSAWVKNGKTPKVGVTGGSYGGYSTLMAMSKFAGAYDAGVAVVGMSNLRSFLNNTAPYRRILRTSEYGDPEKDAKALEELSPTSYLDRVKDPLMIIQGVSDPRVPAGEAIQMHNLLKARGVDAPLILFADEGHGSAKRSNRVLEIGNTLSFFRKHLK